MSLLDGAETVVSSCNVHVLSALQLAVLKGQGSLAANLHALLIDELLKTCHRQACQLFSSQQVAGGMKTKLGSFLRLKAALLS